MPNDCWNHITVISSDPDELITLIHNEFMYKNDKNKLLFHKHIKLLESGDRGIKINCWSAWNPDFEWLSNMIHKYKSCWIKNRWNEEDGLNGIWIGQMKLFGPKIINYEWNELSIDAEIDYFKSSDSP